MVIWAKEECVRIQERKRILCDNGASWNRQMFLWRRDSILKVCKCALKSRSIVWMASFVIKFVEGSISLLSWLSIVISFVGASQFTRPPSLIYANFFKLTNEDMTKGLHSSSRCRYFGALPQAYRLSGLLLSFVHLFPALFRSAPEDHENRRQAPFTKHSSIHKELPAQQ
jgi:hypothetical protein